MPFDGENTCISYDAVNTAFTQAANRVNNHFRHQTMQTCKTLFLRLVCAQFMGNLRSATLEISALLSTRRAGIIHPLSFLLPTFVSLFCIFSFVLQIPGKTVRLDKGHNRQRASSDRHNSHPRCPVLPPLPYGSPVRNTEVSEVSLSEVTVDFVPGTELRRVHATTWRTQTGRWQ